MRSIEEANMRCSFRTAARTILACTAISLIHAVPAQAQFTWTNAAGGNWSVPGNWGGTAPPAGGSATTTLTFGAAGITGASYTATNDLTGIFNLNQLTFNGSAGTTVTLAATGGASVNFTGTTPGISHAGAGIGVVNMPISFDTTTLVSGTGTVTLAGAITGAAGTNNLNYAGTGTLNITGGGNFNSLSLQNGTTLITGGTLTLTQPTAGNLLAGLQMGTAATQTINATINGGATVNALENVFIGDVAGTTGNLTVSGTGTVLNVGTNNPTAASGRLAPGNFGTGNLTINQGAVVNCLFLFNSRQVNSNGNIVVDGAGSQLNCVTVASVVNSGQFSVGNQSSGTLTIQNGGLATGRNVLIGNTGELVGTQGAGNGTLTVTGAGSQLIIGGAQAGNTQGQLVVSSGTAGSTGTTQGTLNVLAGGQVSVNPDSTAAGGNFFSGNATNAVGTTTVSGAGSLLAIANQFSLNSAGGTATMNVNSGGAVTVGGLVLLDQSTTSGTATLNLDTGGTFTGAGQFQTGPGATAAVSAAVSVLGGSNLTVTNNTAFFSIGATASSTLTVSGANSIFQTNGTGQIQFGGSGTTPGGTVTTTISNGGTVKTTNLLVLFGGATTNVNTGGTLSAGAIADGVTGSSVGDISTQTGGVVNITGEASQSYSGTISGGGSVVKGGAGIQTFATATHTYTGGTTINGGSLVILGQIPGGVTVNNGGTLTGATGVSGAGTVAGAVQVNNGGTLTTGAGNATNPTGVFNITGPVTMASGSFFTLGINGNTPGNGTTNYGQINLAGGGSIALGNAGFFSGLGYSPAPTDVVTFITGGPVTGTFLGAPNGSQVFVGAFAGQNFGATINYTANSVFLNNFVPVPEPLHILAIGGLAAGGFGWWKRRKKSAV
jgi:T5SS/PEP-CTERM-associated repeat protein